MKKEYMVKVTGARTMWFTPDTCLLHREDGPAVEHANGDKEWWVNGCRWRVGGPAVDCINGNKEWWVNGKLHREDGPAQELCDGLVVWWVDGEPCASKQDWVNKLNALKVNAYSNVLNGSTIELDGKKYKLELVEESQ